VIANLLPDLVAIRERRVAPDLALTEEFSLDSTSLSNFQQLSCLIIDDSFQTQPYEASQLIWHHL